MNKRVPLVISWLTSLSLVISLCATSMVGGIAKAQSPERSSSGRTRKISADLDEQVRGMSASQQEHVSVILQLKGQSGARLNALLNRNGVHLRGSFEHLNAQAIELPASMVQELAGDPEVSYISVDREIKPLGHVTLTTGADSVRTQTTTTTNTATADLLKNGGATCKPLPSDKSLNTCTTTTTLDGTGIGIAVLDSGVDASHISLGKNSKETKGLRVTFSRDFTGEGRTDDPFGHGTHVASAAAGNGKLSEDYLGIAPGASIINLRVLNSQGTGTVSGVLRALDWVMNNHTAYNIRVVNMSLGMPAIDSYRDDPVCRAVRRLVDAGVVVVAAAGNDGKLSDGQKVYGLIHSPGNEPSALTVGASNTYGTDARDDDGVTTYSSRGPTRSYHTDEMGIKHYDNLLKPDLVAPGNRLIYAEAPGNAIVTQYPQLDAGVSSNRIADSRMMYLSGTSVSSPLTAGAVALLLQANPSLTPNMVKMILTYTAQPLSNFNVFEQGAGQLNLEGAIRLAQAVRTDLSAATPLGAPLLNTGKPPVPLTTIAGKSFAWAQGIVLDHTYATGTNLITQYQKIYGPGLLLSDGIYLSNSTIMSDSTMMTRGLSLGDNIMTSDGTPLGGGHFFCSTGIMVSDGVMVSDGIYISDGIMLSDAVMTGNGVMLSNGIFVSNGIFLSNAFVKGDDTTGMH